MERKKTKVFISYCHDDLVKVQIIEEEVKINFPMVELIIIAYNREALKPLSEKVLIGLKECDIIIPILTDKSINNQWVNQEIGVSVALNKIIRPLVQKDILNKLKGFVHDKVDMPYLFINSSTRGEGHRDFIKHARILIQDIINDIGSPTELISIQPVLKPSLESKLEQIEKSQNFKSKREKILRQQDTFEKAEQDIDSLFKYIQVNLDLLKNRHIIRGTENNFNYPKYFIFKSELHSISFYWKLQEYEKLKGAILEVCYYKDYIITENNLTKNVLHDSGMKFSYQYEYDVDENLNLGWRSVQYNRFYPIESIVDLSIDWFLDEVQASVLEEKYFTTKMNQIIKISKNYSSTFLTRPDVSFDDFITVYSDKVTGWYLDWAEYLNREEHAGFAALQIAFSYFEALAIYKNGRGKVDASGDAFNDEIKRLFEHDLTSVGYNDSVAADAFNLLWKEGRNGFFHAGMSRKGIALEDGNPTVRVKPEDIDSNGKVVRVRIDRYTFIERIKSDFKEYIDHLKNPTNLTQRSKFRSSWNTINLIQIPIHL